MTNSSAPPAQIGMSVEATDTPALLIDLDAFEQNMDLMERQVSRSGVRLRPHAKTHKCAVIARQQMSRGAIGVCCQKVSEAEALVRNGVVDVLISNEIVDSAKLDRLSRLATQAKVAVCVDHAAQVDALSRSATRFNVDLDVLVEIDVGGNRCGVATGEEALLLAQRIARSSNLRFRGLQAYQGRAQHIRDSAAREAASRLGTQAAEVAIELLACHDLQCEVVAGGGTGTYSFDMAGGVYNELQPGSYIFMDADYAQNCDHVGAGEPKFEQSLFVYTQIMSAPGRNYVVVDAGLKAVAVDSGMPWVADVPEVLYSRPSDEHGILEIGRLPDRLRLGDKIKLIPGHCDPTVNLHDWYVGVRGGRVEALWPIVGRGALS